MMTCNMLVLVDEGKAHRHGGVGDHRRVTRATKVEKEEDGDVIVTCYGSSIDGRKTAN